jgi:hypothetical protein
LPLTAERAVSGLAPTGHDFTVAVNQCEECHALSLPFRNEESQ